MPSAIPSELSHRRPAKASGRGSSAEPNELGVLQPPPASGTRVGAPPLPSPVPLPPPAAGGTAPCGVSSGEAGSSVCGAAGVADGADGVSVGVGRAEGGGDGALGVGVGVAAAVEGGPAKIFTVTAGLALPAMSRCRMLISFSPATSLPPEHDQVPPRTTVEQTGKTLWYRSTVAPSSPVPV
ncbi:hypothetical protein ACFDTO_17125 [Microbacteriaceae bacterium 4G12]